MTAHGLDDKADVVEAISVGSDTCLQNCGLENQVVHERTNR